MDWFLKNHVCELNLAENNLVQLLLSKFSLHLVGDAAKLEIEFDGNTPTIRRRESKKVVKDKMPNFASKSIEYQQSLDALLLERKKDELMTLHRSFSKPYTRTLPFHKRNNSQVLTTFQVFLGRGRSEVTWGTGGFLLRDCVMIQ